MYTFVKGSAEDEKEVKNDTRKFQVLTELAEIEALDKSSIAKPTAERSQRLSWAHSLAVSYYQYYQQPKQTIHPELIG